MTELAAPALLLLLAPGRKQELRVTLERGALRLSAPKLPTEDVMRGVLPVVLGVLQALLADIRHGALPAGLVRFPQLVKIKQPEDEVSTTAVGFILPAVLDSGRMTLLKAQSVSGEETVYAQESLTMLYLYAEDTVRRLASKEEAPNIRRLVIGRAPLPVDTVAPHGPVRQLAMLPSHAPRSSAVHDRQRDNAVRKPSPAVVVLVQAHDLRRVTKWAAKAIIQRPDVSVLVCPWWRIRFTDRGAVAYGRVWKGDRKDTVLRRAVISDVPIDVLLWVGGTGDDQPYREAEQQALRRLAPLQIVREGMRRSNVIRKLLLEASRRGVITNANARYEFWDAKHGLEFTLRKYERLGGQAISRPLTYCTRATQMPIVVRSMETKGLHCIVKPTHGSLGGGLQTISPGSSGGLVFSSGRYVVQELVRDPLLSDGRKVDLRCHLLIDPEQRDASGWVPPILTRIAGVPYLRGVRDAENLNLTYQRNRGLRPVIVPLPDAVMLSAELRDEIQNEVRKLSSQLIDAYFSLRADIREQGEIGRRVFLWGFDVALARPNGQLRVYLLENNTRAQLYREDPLCDQAMARLISHHHLDALLRRRRARQSNPRQVLTVPARKLRAP
jgi:hypothetical protein